MSTRLELALQQSLEEWVQKAGGELEPASGGYRCACPIHGGSDKTAFSLHNDGDRWRWKCFSGPCGGGDVVDFIAAWRRVDIARAIEYLTEGTPISQEDARRMAEQRRIEAEAYEQRKREEHQHALELLWQARAWERYYENLETFEDARRLWRGRGIPDDWQNNWTLGYCPSFTYSVRDELYTSPSLTIPIFTGKDQPDNIRHRILNPINPKDKYRPERKGLKAYPFMADPYMINHECVLVVEGEIKAMVSYIWLDSDKWQVYGVQGKESFRELADSLRGRNVWILFDPDAHDKALEAARLIGGARVVDLAMKVDDALNARCLTTASLRRLLTMARKA